MEEAPTHPDAVFNAARRLDDPAARSAYLDEACVGDVGLRQRVEALLRAHEHAGSFLESPAADLGLNLTTDQPPVPREGPGTVVGPYKLLEPIGEGGMGVVFLAEQTRPVRRLVALKVIKAGMDTRQVVARFEAERQALALMDHPNIARVFDAGATDTGRPYFVMELVRGEPITEYCDRNQLPPRQRLGLFTQVCHAVQHAHQKGIIHRDLKPTNVLVAVHDRTPVVKVIDFGVAKALGQELTEKTLFTGFAQLVGTPLYMSPEQAGDRSVDVDTRSDIYSLGVLLYELLTGTTPFDKERFKKAAHEEIRRIIREEEPPKPSTRLSQSKDSLASISALRHTEPSKLTRLVRGDIDWIVMKALEKDRRRRYETANGLAVDVQRYLHDEPVLACPPSTAYRLKKFARRNKGGLTVAALVLCSLVVLGSGVGWSVRDRTARRARVAGQVELTLTEADQLQREQKWPEALAAARGAEAAVAGGEADAATVRRVRDRLRDLEFVDRLEQIRMQRATWVGRNFDYASADRDYGRTFRDYGVDVEALPIETSVERLKARPLLAIPVAAALDEWAAEARWFSRADVAGSKRLVAVARGIDPEPLRDRVRSNWGKSASEVGDELLLAESIDVRSQHPATLLILAYRLREFQRSNAAVRLLRDAQGVHPEDFWLNYALAEILAQQKDRDGAVRFYTAAVSIRPNVVAARNKLGLMLQGQKKLDEAVAVYRRAIELDPRFALAYDNLGTALRRQGKADESIAAFRKAIDLDPKAGAPYNGLGTLLCDDLKQYGEAIKYLVKAVELDPRNPWYHNNLGVSLAHNGKPEAAIECYRKALQIDPRYAPAYVNLGSELLARGNLDDALDAYRKAVNFDVDRDDEYDRLCRALDEIVEQCRAALRKEGDSAPARERLASALNYRARTLANHPDPATRDPRRGVDLATEAVQLAPEVPEYFNTLGIAHYRSGNWKEAVSELGTYRERDPDEGEWSNAFFLAMSHWQLGNKDEAREWCTRAVDRMQTRQTSAEPMRRLRAEAEALIGAVSLQDLAAQRQRRWDGELAKLSRAVVRDPGNPANLAARARWLMVHGRFEEADRDYERLLRIHPTDHMQWYSRACLLAYLGREQHYREHCRAMLAQFAATQEPIVVYRTTKAALLLPPASIGGAGAGVEELARRAERAHRAWPQRTDFLLPKAIAEHRAGRHEQAAQWLKKSDRGGHADAIAADAFLALTRDSLGQRPEARAALERATFLAEVNLPSPSGGLWAYAGVEEWLIARAALREAEAKVLGRQSPIPPQATGPQVPLPPVPATAPSPPAPSASSPFRDKPAVVPGVIQAEDFDQGGESVAYHDTTPQDTGQSAFGRHRLDAVDLDSGPDPGGFSVGGVLAGEWLAYTVEVKQAGNYDLSFHLCSPGGGTLHVEAAGKDLTGPVDVPKTGWFKWTTVPAKRVRLEPGRQVMRVVFDSAAPPDVYVCNLNWIEARRSP